MFTPATPTAAPLIQKVREAIDVSLAGYDHHPCRQTFAAPELKEQLVAYVLQRIPATVSEVNFSPNSTLQHLVTEGIRHLMIQNAEWVSLRAPHPPAAADAPSCWFG